MAIRMIFRMSFFLCWIPGIVLASENRLVRERIVRNGQWVEVVRPGLRKADGSRLNLQVQEPSDMNWPTFGDYFLCAAYLGVPLSDIDGIGSVPGDSDPDTVLVESGADILSPLLYREKAGHRAVRAMESLFCRLSSLVPGSSLFDRKELGAGDAVRLVEPRFFKDGGAHEIALTYLVYDDSWKRSLDEVCRVFGYARFAGDLDLSAPLDPKNVVVYSSRIWTREYYDRKNETNQMDFGQFDFGWKKAGSGSFFPTIRSLGCK